MARLANFSPLPFCLSIGSGIGLLSICNIIADSFMLDFKHKHKIFGKIKLLDVLKKRWTEAVCDQQQLECNQQWYLVYLSLFGVYTLVWDF